MFGDMGDTHAAPHLGEGGLRSTFSLLTESLRCPCCKARFYFAEHAARVWRTQCPNGVCGEVLVVSRVPSFRFRVERVGAHLLRRGPEPPGFAQFVRDHWFEIGLAASQLFVVIPLLCTSAAIRAALLVVGIAMGTTIVCGVLLAWGASRWSNRRDASVAHRRRGARELGRTPFATVSPVPGWFPE